MSGWRQSKAWADEFTRSLKMILGVVLFRDATDKEDQKEASDLVFAVDACRIGARVRNFSSYKPRYAGEFTVRAARDSGARTEWQKVVDDGHCDLLLYAWVDRAARRVISWVVIDLEVLRQGVASGEISRPNYIPNGDGTYFHALNTTEHPRLVFAKSSNWGQEASGDDATGRP